MNIARPILALAVPLALAACASPTLPPAGAPAVPSAWRAPLPDERSVSLQQWWLDQGDPLLVQLIAAAQKASPDLAAAHARIAQAQAERVAGSAALLPSLQASSGVSRGHQAGSPVTNSSQSGLQASWEIDLFGANRAGRDAAQARLAGEQAGWHAARVSVAAETAGLYLDLRSCDRLLEVTEADAFSRERTARLTGLTVGGGLEAPATVALARASAAEGRSRVSEQRAQCIGALKGLVAMTAMDEDELLRRLKEATPVPQLRFSVETMPAALLAQRPDVFQAERAVEAAVYTVDQTAAQRYPKLTLNGSIERSRLSAGGLSQSQTTWSFGPLALSLPLFDGGRRQANLEASKVQYQAAVSAYHGAVRRAVSEVETAMVNLHSTGERTIDAQVALEGYRIAFASAEARHQEGLGSLLDLEEIRRRRFGAEAQAISLERERDAAWLSLYRAAGGGWRVNDPAPTLSLTTVNP